ncbi:MAG: 2Fe-2S iron-sulfur cluster-binding protein [bacterium]|nr:2Fe-2S iron-sulfur cluster-binding protein [bacterium]
MAKLFFRDEDKEIEIRAGENILEVALENGIHLDHACGGVCACSTCHVKILEGGDFFPEAEEEEEDQLDNARDVDLNSRLACQSVLVRDTNEAIVVEIPFWNVNLVKEGPDAAREAH